VYYEQPKDNVIQIHRAEVLMPDLGKKEGQRKPLPLHVFF
jgi:hypothetical protein